eukprot:1048690-Ditylum_brightwellii.AAC.1
MSDDLHNIFGCFLIPEHQTLIQAVLHDKTQASFDALINIVNETLSLSNSSTLMHQDLKQFN